MTGASLRLEGVGVRYPRWELGPVSVTLPPGCTVLVGENGAGKTTLMRALVGLQPVSAGHVALDGVDSRTARGRRELRSLIGYLPQDPVFPRLVTARDAVSFAADLKGIRGRARVDAVERALVRVELEDRASTRASQLSGGQQRRLALAQATVHSPALVVLDEPTAGLDPVQRRDFTVWLRNFCADNSALVSTHMVEDVTDVASHVIVLAGGRTAFVGTQEDLLVSTGSSTVGDALWSHLRGQR